MKHRIRLVVGIALILLLAACHAPGTADASASHDGTMVLKIYSVPVARTGNLANALQDALGKKANVTAAAPGKLLVYAPQSAQTSIASAIATLGQDVKTEQASQQLQVSFWIVDGEPGVGTDDPALKALAPTLNTLRKSVGPLHFKLSQAVSAVTDSDHKNSVVQVSQGLNAQQFVFGFDGINANSVELNIAFSGGISLGLRQLQTQLKTPLGQYVVLAQAPIHCFSASGGTTFSSGKVSAPPPCSDQQSLRLLIVRVDRVSHSP